jgi:hypothetical protein
MEVELTCVISPPQPLVVIIFNYRFSINFWLNAVLHFSASGSVVDMCTSASSREISSQFSHSLSDNTADPVVVASECLIRLGFQIRFYYSSKLS